MEFEKLLIQINEVLHKSIQKYKQEVVGNNSYSDITLSQLYYIEAVYNLGTPTVSELSSHLKITKASTSEGVRKLIDRGLLMKTQSSQDRRVFHLSLSESGLKLIEAEAGALSEFVSNIKNSLDDSEMYLMGEIFKKILKNYTV